MKVTIIGASVSGLFTAYLLVKKGVEVEVYEKKKELGWPPCTLITTGRIAEILDFVPEEAVINRVRYIELFSRSRSARLELREPDLVLERERLVSLLFGLAKGSGAKIMLSHRFEGLAQFGRKIVGRFKDLEAGVSRPVSSDILIGADGAMSTVRRAASRDSHPLTALLQARVPLPGNVSPDTCQVWFDSNRTTYFHWLIPESRETAAAGLVADDKDQAKASFEAFLQERGLEPLEFQAAAVPLHRFDPLRNGQVPNRNVFFVGDAAAQVKGTTVGGIVTGLHGARALANAILNGRNYRKELRELKRELDLHLLVRRVLNWFDEKDYDALISMLDGGLKDILEESTRDELSNSFLSLIVKEPRLITLGAKAFLKSLL